MDPLDYIVADAWRHLFKFLSAGDKEVLCQTCKTFQAMLQPQKTEWAFGLILPHYIKMVGSGRNIDRKRQLVESLRFRLVCKAWRAGFDKCCENREYIQYLYIPRYSFSDDIALEKFLNFFNDHRGGGNPFVVRDVLIYAAPSTYENSNDFEDDDFEEEGVNGGNAENQDRKMQKYRKLQIEFLSTYGKEIDQLSMSQKYYHSEEKYCSEEEAWKFLQLVLCNTPNLQSLRLNLRPPDDNTCPYTLEKSLAKYFELNPLPNLPKLRSLRLSKGSAKIEAFILEKYGKNLLVLSTCNSLELSSDLWGSMKGLKELTLYDSEFTCNEKILRAIQSPLQIICICEKKCQERKSSPFLIDKFLLAIQHLPLKEITVVPASKIVKEAAPFSKEFPKHMTIESFCLEIRNSDSISIGFTFFLPNLKNLYIGGNNFQYHSYLRQLK